jgi:transposase
MRRKGDPKEWERVRLIAANMFERKMKPKEIAALLEVDDQTVRRWRRVWRATQRDGLKARKPPGGPSKLSDPQKQQLLQMLTHKPEQWGFNACLWTTKLIAQLIEKQFGVRHHHDHVGTILRQLGWSVQKPARRAKERDEQRIESWRSEFWPTLEKKVATGMARSSSPMKSDS